MHKVVYLPLDERPCNALFPVQIAKIADMTLVSPPISILGKKKQHASFDRIKEWLKKEVVQADYLILSIDMLVYGGILPSRLHYWTVEECRNRLAALIELKQLNPRLQIYAFNLITRTPAYNSSEEEPDYYAEHGYDLFKYGWLNDKKERESLTPEESAELEGVQARLPRRILDDFLNRRSVNTAINLTAIEYVKKDVIDFLIIPLDDNAKYGFTPMEQRKLLFTVEESNLMDRVHIYPGADEIGCILFARVFCRINRYVPEVFVRYSSTHGPSIIPKYEDRSLNESIKCHLTTAGAFIGDSSAEADFVLMVNSPPVSQYDVAEPTQAFSERHRAYFSEIHYREFATAIESYANKGKMVALADVATCNGGDTALMKLLSKSGLLPRISAYAAWNTSGNSLGTVIAHAIVESYYRRGRQTKADEERNTISSREFYLYRLVEDWGYQSLIRQHICEHHLPELGGSYFSISHIRGQVYELIEAQLKEFIEANLQQFTPEHIHIEGIDLPWDRMFEVGFELRLEP